MNNTIDYDPSDVSQYSAEGQRKLDLYTAKLCEYRDSLPSSQHSRYSTAKLKELALSLLDGTIFEIVMELKHIQQLRERDLLNKRVKMVSAHKSQKTQMLKKHREELLSLEHRQHNIPLVKSKHEKELGDMEQQLTEETRSTDRSIILELDQLVTDQQSTLQQAAVPFFKVTNNAQDLQVQMNILRFIQKLYSQERDTHFND